jgi:hypothetical protein
MKINTTKSLNKTVPQERLSSLAAFYQEKENCRTGLQMQLHSMLKEKPKKDFRR